MRKVLSFPARKTKVSFAILLAGLMILLAPSVRADDLHYFKNYFVTGDYSVEGVGLYGKGVNGWSTGTISMTAQNDVPAGADIVAAFLYWETVESTAAPSSTNGFFDNNAIVGAVLGNPQTTPCRSSGGTSGPGQVLRVYRADVLRYLNTDKTNNIHLADYAHTVKLPDSGGGGNGQTPHTEGASLVVVYKVQTPGAAYKAVVVYDGASTMTKSSAAFTQTIGGFYQASGSGAKMTQIVGNGQSGFADTLTVTSPSSIGNITVGVNGTPFIGAQGTRWDNLTYAINLATGASSLTTQVTGDNNQVCLSWGAVITSTNVVNTDGDGLLDIWKTKGLHLNVGSTTTNPPTPATFGGCSDYPNDPCENFPAMGAVLGTALKPHPDIFAQIDWMQGSNGHIHVPKLAGLSMVASAFLKHNIYVHFDVGSHYQQNPALSYIVPAAYAKGGNAILESALECTNTPNNPPCAYNSSSLGYSVVGWKKGFDAIKNGFQVLNIPQYFPHDRKDTFHYILFGHALATFDPNTGLPAAVPTSVSGVADAPGGDLLVTLGLWPTADPSGCVQDDPTGLLPLTSLCSNQTGTALVQAGTVMHELGHNLGLQHGGSVRMPNCMPNYQSVMNYLYQTRGLTDAAGNENIDFSPGSLVPLSENSLSESVSMGPLKYRVRFYAPPTSFEIGSGATAQAHCDGSATNGGLAVRLEAPGLNTPDWDNNDMIGVSDGAADANTVFQEDVNFNGTVGDPVLDSVVPGQGLFLDHSDWTGLNLQQMGGRLNVDGLSADVSASDLGQLDLGQLDLGQLDLGQLDLGQLDLGQLDLGQLDLGQLDLGEVDYNTVVSTLDATGDSTPLAASYTATVPANGNNQISLNWGPPSIGLITNYFIFRVNVDAASNPVQVGTMSAMPLMGTYTFTDVITDTNPADFGASPNCISALCFNTNYEYFITATNGTTTSTPSNFVAAIVDHLFVTAPSESVVYGNTIPAFNTSATVSGMPSGGITSTSFSCANTTGSVPPRNVGSYAVTCTGPAAVAPQGSPAGSPANIGITYIPGGLNITQRPLTITAVTNTKLYDGTISASAIPMASVGTSSSGVGLINGDTITAAETYNNRNAGNGKTLSVSAYIVMDQNNGGNYAPVTLTPVSTGVITQRPLSITAVTNTKTYDGTTIASAIPIVVAATSTTGLVSPDSVTGLAEAYDTRNAGVGKTLSVSAYTVNDGNNGGNYAPVSRLTNTTGVINQRSLTITAQPNKKIYDGTTSARAIPIVTAATSTTGLVLPDTITGLAETYNTPYIGTGKTLTVSSYTINDGNSGKNYAVTKVANNNGVITDSDGDFDNDRE